MPRPTLAGRERDLLEVAKSTHRWIHRRILLPHEQLHDFHPGALAADRQVEQLAEAELARDRSDGVDHLRRGLIPASVRVYLPSTMAALRSLLRDSRAPGGAGRAVTPALRYSQDRGLDPVPLDVLLAHLLKWKYQPGARSSGGCGKAFK